MIAGSNMQLPIQSAEDVKKIFEEAHKSGLVSKLGELSAAKADSVTKATYLGIAVTKEAGDMDYYFAAEISEEAEVNDLETMAIPAARWAIFTSGSASLEDIGRLEQYAYGEWFSKSGYKIVDIPQMNVFLSDDGREYAELWIPIVEDVEENPMRIRPYLTFAGQCAEAIELYKRAFKTDTLQVVKFSDMPPDPNFPLPDEAKDLILQAIMQFGNDAIRLSDCFGVTLNEQESERTSIVVETSTELVQHAFAVLAEEGRVGIELSEQFYSPCTGVVFDKFGVMWNLVAQG